MFNVDPHGVVVFLVGCAIALPFVIRYLPDIMGKD